MIKKYTQWFWFIGGFAVGLTLISLGHAAINKGQSLSEMRTTKVATPELESDFSKLESLESRFAENAEQQKKLKAAVSSGKYRARN